MPYRTPVRTYAPVDGDEDALWFLDRLITLRAVGAASRAGQITVVRFAGPHGVDAAPRRHPHQEELFYMLSGAVRISCDGEDFVAGSGELVVLPVGLAHSFAAVPGPAPRALHATTPCGFDHDGDEHGEHDHGGCIGAGTLVAAAEPFGRKAAPATTLLTAARLSRVR